MGTASDSGGGRIWGVEMSLDGGNTWQPAVGRENWTFAWTPHVPVPVTIKCRAVDDSGNLESPTSGVNVIVAGSQTTIWSSGTVPGTLDAGADNPLELGVKFYSEVGGAIKGSPVLQVLWQHRHTRWQSLVEHGHFAWIGNL